MITYCIKHGHVLDPVSDIDGIRDLFVIDGQIHYESPATDIEISIIDATDQWVIPGLIDVHVHLREPGNEAAETIETGSHAAACGGFSHIVSMPNTIPAVDTPEKVRWIIERAREAGYAHVCPSACLTVDRKGERVAELEALAEAGAVAFTDDGCTVTCNDVMLAAMKKAAELGLPVMDHAQDHAAEKRGVMHEGRVSQAAGLPGIPSSAETNIVRRDIELATRTGCHVHIQHVTCGETVDLIRQARHNGIKVSGELTPHHLVLCDEDIDPDNANYKMNPPLRSREDREKLIEGILDGTLNCFATDHAPHTADRKARGFVEAPFGVVGLETAVGITYTELVLKGLMDMKTWLRRWGEGPATVLGKAVPTLAAGKPANLAILDTYHEWVVNPAAFISRSCNTPFKGKALFGNVTHMFLDGRLVYQN